MSNSLIQDSDIPKSYSSTPDRPPFEQIGVRDQYINQFDVPNKSLTDKESADLINNPPPVDKGTRLDDMTKKANKTEMAGTEDRKIYNLSVKQIGYRISDTWHDILDDLLTVGRIDGLRGFILCDCIKNLSSSNFERQRRRCEREYFRG